jgi:hypothetical protein
VSPVERHQTPIVCECLLPAIRREYPMKTPHQASNGHLTADGASDARNDSEGGAHLPSVDRHTVVSREKERYGGIKVGSAFFGWLTATGTAVILIALLAAAGTAMGLASGTDAGEAAGRASQDTKTVGIVGGIALLLVLLVSYYCGGYVAGRMARFNGAKQGLAVWLWSVAIAVVVAVVGAVAGSRFDVLARLNGFPRIPVNEGTLSTTGLVTTLAIAVAALIGAVLGGLAGMRFHRQVDKAGLGH